MMQCTEWLLYFAKMEIESHNLTFALLFVLKIDKSHCWTLSLMFLLSKWFEARQKRYTLSSRSKTKKSSDGH